MGIWHNAVPTPVKSRCLRQYFHYRSGPWLSLLRHFLLSIGYTNLCFFVHVTSPPVAPQSKSSSTLINLCSMLARLFLLATLPVTWATRQCYIDPGIEAVPGVLPCSNIDNGPDSSCCVAGDICLQNNACWNQRLGITYLYGCTDPTYNHDSCPNKCGYSSGVFSHKSLLLLSY